MQRIFGLLIVLGLGATVAATAAEYNPVRSYPVGIGPEMSRVIVGFRATANNSVVQTFKPRDRAQAVTIVQAKTSDADVSSLASRVGLPMTKSRQLTPSMHVIYLKQTLYGVDVETALTNLRADSAVQFADIDQRRYPLSLPDDPLFVPTTGASGQWYMQTPSQTTGDLAATDAVSAWGITTGNTGTVIADVDTGVRFDHPDLLRAGLGGRLLPGYDFVGEDETSAGVGLGTYLIANDGDGWDPDPSDPGDWISSTDQQNSLFPASSCPIANSSWHGTRVVGILGAITNNDVGIAGMTWGSWILPVRALGKCSGYDSDIIAGIEWAAGMSVATAANPVPDNPYPANIINLSLGGSGSCISAYQITLTAVTNMGALVVVSAGNASGAVGAPANCSASVPGVIAVAGLRNVGTKVGYSSFGPEVGISAPAGNCVNTVGACLKSIDTTTNLGTTVPGDNSYTNETNSNLGTSFSAPIVSGIAGLMRAVNGNLTPTQLVTRLESSATPFPTNTNALPVCPASVTGTEECSCPPSGECGTGMANALSAVNAALNPIAAVSFPASYAANSAVVFNASGSAAACMRTIQSYAWTASGGLNIVSGSASAQVTVSGTGTLTLTVTDAQGGTDVATVTVGSTSATSTAPSTAGSNSCASAVSFSPAAPTLTQAFVPATTGTNTASTLTITLNNSNAFALTQSDLIDTLPASLSAAGTGATTCGGAAVSLVASGTSIALTGAVIPANDSCTVTLPVSSTTVGNYTSTIAANALTTGPAGGNTATATATLAVTAPVAPTITETFAPTSVSTNTKSTLTISLSNSNAYPLTQISLADTLPSGVTLATSPAAANTCNGSLATTAGAATISGGTIPASGSCTITLSVSSGTTGTYTNTIAAGALTSAQSTSNTATAAGSLTVTAPSHGGGALDWLDLTFIAGALLAGRRKMLWNPQRHRQAGGTRRLPDQGGYPTRSATPLR
jgi:serine protease